MTALTEEPGLRPNGFAPPPPAPEDAAAPLLEAPPDALAPAYGGHNPLGAMGFVRVKID